MADNDSVETKLSAARTRLILDKPFLGALVMRLPMIRADAGWCPTTATDARAFYYNHEYIDRLTLAETQFILGHEALHCALSHFARRQHRNKMRWDLACDYAVNPLLVRDGLTPPPGALMLEEFEDMTAEEIYPCIEENDDSRLLDQHLYDREGQSNPEQPGGSQGKRGGQGGENESEDGDRGDHREQAGPGSRQQELDEDGRGNEADRDGRGDHCDSHRGAAQPPPLSREEQDTLSVQWRQHLASAAQQAMQAGKLSGAMARMVDHLLQPQLPWRVLLARYMTATARDDYSYSRPSRREGEAIFPSLRSAEIDVMVVLDSSGSLTDRELGEFMAEVNAIKSQTRARITLHACDAALAKDGPWRFEPWEECRLPGTLTGGGGTDFRPVFDWLQQSGERPDLLVYFTDAQGPFPETEPQVPVIWLVKGRGRVPWGLRIQLN